jgi:hypothetical protein
MRIFTCPFLISFPYSIKTFIYYFKHVLDMLKVDPIASDECKMLCEDLQTSISLYNKFDELWN